MALQFYTTGQVNLRNGVKFVVYAGAGVGKTRLTATAPRPLIVSAERGLLSLRRENIPAVDVSTYPLFQEFITWAYGSNERKNFDTFAVDSLSDICETLLAAEKMANTDKKNGFAPYNNLAEKVLNDLRRLRDVPEKHIYFIAKEEREKDASGMMMYGPSFPGRALSADVPYLVDEIFRLTRWQDQQGANQLALQCQLSTTAIAKDRSGALDMWEPAHLGHILNKMMSAQ